VSLLPAVPIASDLVVPFEPAVQGVLLIAGGVHDQRRSQLTMLIADRQQLLA
jgi:hypothetical protein